MKHPVSSIILHSSNIPHLLCSGSKCKQFVIIVLISTRNKGGWRPLLGMHFLSVRCTFFLATGETNTGWILFVDVMFLTGRTKYHSFVLHPTTFPQQLHFLLFQIASLSVHLIGGSCISPIGSIYSQGPFDSPFPFLHS
jgi:hypothetical protein